jgi:hypothetical protein
LKNPILRLAQEYPPKVMFSAFDASHHVNNLQQSVVVFHQRPAADVEVGAGMRTIIPTTLLVEDSTIMHRASASKPASRTSKCGTCHHDQNRRLQFHQPFLASAFSFQVSRLEKMKVEVIGVAL